MPAGTQLVRTLFTFPPMTVSYVLRLVDHRLSQGEIVGQAEHVETGERQVVGQLSELLAFFQRTSSNVGQQNTFDG